MSEAERPTVVLAPRIGEERIPLPGIPSLFQHPHADLILTEFRWRAYLRANPDVAANNTDEASARRHFYYTGYYERRIFEPARLHGFDGAYYRERYPELALASDADAHVHYCYVGYYEGRTANRDVAWFQDADLHVFQMGKVGSHSIAAGLKAAGSERKVIQLHWMADFHITFPHLRVPYRQLLLRPRDKPVQVISATREIVSWTIASLFQYFGREFASTDEARALFEERFWETAQAGLSWFDHGYFCGLDVYRTPFPHEAGMVRIVHPPIDLLVYRQEDLPRLSGELAGFLGMPDFVLGEANVGETKDYSDMYREFAADFRLPGNLLARLYDEPMMRHFYSDDEREAGFRRWVG